MKKVLILSVSLALSLFAIDINSANEEELAGIKGIGATKAKAIVDYRKANGKFKDYNDLLNVKGIGEDTLDNIKNDVKDGDKINSTKKAKDDKVSKKDMLKDKEDKKVKEKKDDMEKQVKEKAKNSEKELKDKATENKIDKKDILKDKEDKADKKVKDKITKETKDKKFKKED